MDGRGKLASLPVAFYAAIFFLVNATYVALCWELLDRTPVKDMPPKGTQGNARRIYLYPVPFRGGRVCGAKISASWTWNLLFVPDRLSEARRSRNLNVCG
jgi:hypothetical protein